MSPAFFKSESPSSNPSVSISMDGLHAPNNSLKEAAQKMQAKSANFPKFFLMNTILPFIIANVILGSLTLFREGFVRKACFCPTEVCRCSLAELGFYSLLMMPLSEIIPYSLVYVMLFCCRNSVIPQFFKLALSLIFVFIITPLSYFLLPLYYPWLPSRLINYAIALCLILLSLTGFCLGKKKNIRHFVRECSLGALCFLVLGFYYLLTEFLLPNFSILVKLTIKKQTRDVFQIMMVAVNFLYETVFFQVLLRISHFLLQQGVKSNTLLTILVRYYLTSLYVIRLGSIISLQIGDFGLYLQLISLLVLVFETSTGRSFSKYCIVKPISFLGDRFRTIVKRFHEISIQIPIPEKKCSMKKRFFFMGTSVPFCKDHSSFRTIAKKAIPLEKLSPSPIPKLNVPHHPYEELIRKAQKRLLDTISYQKFEFFLIYVPAMMSIGILQRWRIADPEKELSEVGGFGLCGLEVHLESMMMFIVVDLIFTFLFFKVFECYKDLRLKYELGKMDFIVQILLYIGYQLIIERGLGSIAALQRF